MIWKSCGTPAAEWKLIINARQCCEFRRKCGAEKGFACDRDWRGGGAVPKEWSRTAEPRKARFLRFAAKSRPEIDINKSRLFRAPTFDLIINKIGAESRDA